MALVDYEAVVLDLEAYIEAKPGRSFGERELPDELRRLRQRHRKPEGLVEKALRLYDAEMQDASRRGPSPAPFEEGAGMGDGAPIRVAP